MRSVLQFSAPRASSSIGAQNASHRMGTKNAAATIAARTYELNGRRRSRIAQPETSPGRPFSGQSGLREAKTENLTANQSISSIISNLSELLNDDKKVVE